jgi:uncharacterized protein YuzE
MNTTIKDSLQNIFRKNYNLFLKIEINGVDFEVMPIQKDIPIIDNVNYFKELDMLEIEFKNVNRSKHDVEMNENLTVVMNNENEIIGFQIFKIKELVKSSNAKKINEKLEIKKHNEEALNLRESIKENYTKRNLHSIREFIMGDATQLIYG